MSEKFRNPLLTVDIIIEIGGRVVLIERKNPPHGWALPGGFVDYGESLESAAVREAREETSLDVELIEQFHTIPIPAATCGTIPYRRCLSPPRRASRGAPMMPKRRGCFTKTICPMPSYLTIAGSCAIILFLKKGRRAAKTIKRALPELAQRFSDAGATCFDILKRGGIGKSYMLL
jgi:hypothetical protein